MSAGEAVFKKEFQLNGLYDEGYFKQTHTLSAKDSFKYILNMARDDPGAQITLIYFVKEYLGK